MWKCNSVFVAHWGPGGWDWCSSEQHSAGVVPLKLETSHPWVVALCVKTGDARVPPELLAWKSLLVPQHPKHAGCSQMGCGLSASAHR